MATVVCHNCMQLAATKQVNLGNGGDTIKMILMAPGFTYNRGTQFLYADVSSNEVATAYGYTAGGTATAGQAVARNDTTFKSVFTINTQTFTPSGGNISACGAFLMDTTVSGSPLIMYIDFLGTITAVPGQPLVVNTPEMDLNC